MGGRGLFAGGRREDVGVFRSGGRRWEGGSGDRRMHRERTGADVHATIEILHGDFILDHLDLDEY